MAKLWTRAFIMINIINFLLFLSFNMINPILPVYLQEVGISESMIGAIVAIFTLGSISTRPLAGNTVDRFGRKQVFLLTLLLLCLMVFSYTIFTTVAMLICLRLIHGFDWGFASTAASTIATDSIPRVIFGKGIGFFGISMGLSLAIAPGLALAIYNASDYQTMMYVSTGVLVLALVMALFFPYRTDNLRAKQEGSKAEGFKLERSAVLPSIIMGCATLTMSAVTSFVALYAASAGIGNIGMFFTVYAVGLVIARPVMGTMIDKLSTFAIALPSYAMLLIALLLMSFSHSLTTLLVAGFIYGFGYGGAQTAVQTMAIAGAPEDHYGAANGTFFIGFDIGIGVGALLAGALAGAIGYALMYRVVALFIALGMVLLCYRRFTQTAR